MEIKALFLIAVEVVLKVENISDAKACLLIRQERETLYSFKSQRKTKMKFRDCQRDQNKWQSCSASYIISLQERFFTLYFLQKYCV